MGKKICMVSNTYWSFTRFRTDVIKALIADGYEVLLLAPRDEHVLDLTTLGARVITLKELTRKGRNPVNDIRLYYEFKSIYQTEKPDLIIQYTIKPNIYSTLAASQCGIPAIAVVTGLGYTFINKGIITILARKLYRVALRKANQVWFLNEDDHVLFVKNGLVRRDQTKRIPGEGVDCHGRFNPSLLPYSEQPDAAVTRFLFVGRLLYDKGIREYIEAATYMRQKNPNVNFQILGYLNVDNPAAMRKEELMKMVEDGVVEYLGNTNDVRPYVLQADCVVLPSYSEGMSTVLQESASLGKPIIASNIAGCKELINDGETGFLCEVRDTKSLVKQLETFVGLTKNQRRLMGEKGRWKMINEFSVEQIIAIYKKEIRLMID